VESLSTALTSIDPRPIWLTLKLAGITTLVLIFIATPLAWWLANTRSRLKQPLSALVALPLVLPPTVLGFYILVLLGPHGPIGRVTQTLGLGVLPFTFAGLVVASTLYSLPFTLQPIQNAFEAIGKRPLEVAATLRASPWQRFFYIALPLARPGLLTAAILAFAHTLGEFVVVLMIGGNIPGATQVLSVAIYNHVEAMEYQQAHWLAGGMVLFSFSILLMLYTRTGKMVRLTL
jgi:molybdate transport system permease protein